MTTRLLQAIERVISHTNNSKYFLVLRYHAEKIFQSSYDRLLDDCDRQLLKEQYQNVVAMLERRKAAIDLDS